MDEKKITLTERVIAIEGWIKDNGAWGAKTKLAQMWDWYIARRDKDKKIDEIENKVERSECDLRNEKLIKRIEEIIDKKDKNWRWWVEQLKWMLPMGLAVLMWLSQKGFI